jgi:hypothetical protein
MTPLDGSTRCRAFPHARQGWSSRTVTVPLDQGCEAQLGDITMAGREPLQDPPVRQVPQGPDVEERLAMPLDGTSPADRHGLILHRLASVEKSGVM